MAAERLSGIDCAGALPLTAKLSQLQYLVEALSRRYGIVISYRFLVLENSCKKCLVDSLEDFEGFLRVRFSLSPKLLYYTYRPFIRLVSQYTI